MNGYVKKTAVQYSDSVEDYTNTTRYLHKPNRTYKIWMVILR